MYEVIAQLNIIYTIDFSFKITNKIWKKKNLFRLVNFVYIDRLENYKSKVLVNWRKIQYSFIVCSFRSSKKKIQYIDLINIKH